MKEYSVIGKRLPGLDSPAKARGQAQYTADLTLPHLLHGKVLHSPFPHALIKSIDTSRAARLPGVRAIITGADTAGVTFGIVPGGHDEYPLAIGKIRYAGDAVAGVAAIDEDTAEEALSLIDVEYEPLPYVMDPELAMDEGAPNIHADKERNISREVHWEWGDVEKGFAESDVILEERFVTPAQNHAPMELHAAIANFEPTGQLTIWSSTQIPFFLRYNLAKTLKMSESDVRVIKPFVGGGFGGKVDMFAKDYCAAHLSKITGCPVKIVYTREEVFACTRQTYPKVIYIKMGVTKDGRLTARHSRIVYDNGAYNSTGPMIVWGRGIQDIPYTLPASKFDGYLVYTNKMPAGPLRGHTNQQLVFGVETVIEKLARSIGMDPVDLRMKNAVYPGYVSLKKHYMGSCALKECIETVRKSSGWDEKHGKLGPYRGLGFAISSFGGGLTNVPHNPTSEIIQLNADGRVTLLTGSSDIGQGSESTLAMITAETLGISQDDVTVYAADTALTPLDHGTFGSRVTYQAGNSTRVAAEEARKQLFEAVAEVLECSPEDLEARDRRIWVKGSPERGMDWGKALKAIQQKDKLPIIVKSYWHRTDLGISQNTETKIPFFAFYAESAEVEVDPGTGEVKVLNITYANDCGTQINPMRVEGQLEGAVHMGVGMALCEEVMYDKGQTLNASFLTYRMATAADMPEMDGIHLDTEDPEGPYGAKEAGEGAVCPTTPAIVSAIYDATGIWFHEMPITPERMLKALEEKRKKSAK